MEIIPQPKPDAPIDPILQKGLDEALKKAQEFAAKNPPKETK